MRPSTATRSRLHMHTPGKGNRSHTGATPTTSALTPFTLEHPSQNETACWSWSAPIVIRAKPATPAYLTVRGLAPTCIHFALLQFPPVHLHAHASGPHLRASSAASSLTRHLAPSLSPISNWWERRCFWLAASFATQTVLGRLFWRVRVPRCGVKDGRDDVV